MNLIFKCPETSLNVQHWLEDREEEPVHQYEAVICQACTKLDFINRTTGKLLGHDDE